MTKGRSLFKANKSGLIEIFFAEEELKANIELLILVKKLCDAIISSHIANPSDSDKDQLNKLIDNSNTASVLIDKLLLDSEVTTEKTTEIH